MAQVTGTAQSSATLEAAGWTMVASGSTPGDWERWEEDSNTANRLCINRETTGDNINIATGHCGTTANVPPVRQISIGK